MGPCGPQPGPCLWPRERLRQLERPLGVLDGPADWRHVRWPDFRAVCLALPARAQHSTRCILACVTVLMLTASNNWPRPAFPFSFVPLAGPFPQATSWAVWSLQPLSFFRTHYKARPADPGHPPPTPASYLQGTRGYPGNIRPRNQQVSGLDIFKITENRSPNPRVRRSGPSAPASMCSIPEICGSD